MAEISDTELAQLKMHSKLLSGLYNDPEDGMKVKHAIKRIDPTQKIPEIDMEAVLVNPVKEELKAATTKVADLEGKLNALQDSITSKDEENKFTQSFQKLSSMNGLTDAGQQGVIELMRKEKIADPQAGIDLYLHRNPPAPPVTASNWESPVVTMLENPEDKPLGSTLAEIEKNPMKFTRNKIKELINDKDFMRSAALGEIT